MIKIKTDHIK